MLGELELARVKGLGYTDYLNDIIRLVRYNIKESYRTKYPMLNQFNIDEEEVEVRVYQSLFNRKDVSEYSNMEKYFIKASELAGGETGPSAGTKYISALIKRVVANSFSEICRSLLRKKALPTVSFNEEFCDGKTLLGLIEDTVASKGFEDTILYDDFLMSLPLTRYNYDIELNGKKRTLNSRLLLDLFVIGYKSKEIAEMCTHKKTGMSPSKTEIDRLKKTVIVKARKYFYEYFGE